MEYAIITTSSVAGTLLILLVAMLINRHGGRIRKHPELKQLERRSPRRTAVLDGGLQSKPRAAASAVPSTQVLLPAAQSSPKLLVHASPLSPTPVYLLDQVIPRSPGPVLPPLQRPLPRPARPAPVLQIKNISAAPVLRRDCIACTTATRLSHAAAITPSSLDGRQRHHQQSSGNRDGGVALAPPGGGVLSICADVFGEGSCISGGSGTGAAAVTVGASLSPGGGHTRGLAPRATQAPAHRIPAPPQRQRTARLAPILTRRSVVAESVLEAGFDGGGGVALRPPTLPTIEEVNEWRNLQKRTQAAVKIEAIWRGHSQRASSTRHSTADDDADASAPLDPLVRSIFDRIQIGHHEYNRTLAAARRQFEGSNFSAASASTARSRQDPVRCRPECVHGVRLVGRSESGYGR